MDDFKDAQRTDSSARGLDNTPVRFSPFGENRSGDRAYRKAERIVTAIHLVTNHIDASEPVRAAVRARAVELLPAMLSLRDRMRVPRSREMISCNVLVREIISLVHVLSAAGYISMSNVQLMTAALEELAGMLVSSQRSALSESVVLSREDLTDVRINSPYDRNHAQTIKDVQDVKVVKDEHISVSNSSTSVSATHKIGQSSARSQHILDTLRGSNSLGIKEIWAHLPEYSEKMIQRELLALVADGEVHKTGLKRWSKYSLA